MIFNWLWADVLTVCIYITVCSFNQGDVFVVDNVIDSDWLWVTAQKNQEKGLVPAALVEDAVSCLIIFQSK